MPACCKAVVYTVTRRWLPTSSGTMLWKTAARRTACAATRRSATARRNNRQNIEGTKTMSAADPAASQPRRSRLPYVLTILLTAGATFGIVALLMNMSQRKHEAREHYVQLVELTEETVDPAEWGKNFPRQYDAYRRTVDNERTR